MFGHIDHDVDKQVAVAVTVRVGKTLVSQSEHLAGLSSGFDVNSHSAIYGRHFHFASKHSGREVEHKVVDEVFAVALEFVVGFFFNLNDEVARDSAARSIVAVSLHAQEHTFSHAGGYVHAHHLFFAFESYAAAFRAAFFNNLAFAFAVRAHRLGLHLSEESLLHFSDIACAVAVATCGEFGAVFCSGAFAVGASHHARYFELFLHAVSHFFEVNLHAHAQVGASFCGRALATRASEATKTAKSAESATENVAEIAENIVDIVETAAETTGTIAINTCMAKLVVASAFVLIAKHAIGFSSLFKTLFGFFLLGIRLIGLTVGVIFHSHLAVGFFQFIVRSVFAHAKHFVIVSFFCHNCLNR